MAKAPLPGLCKTRLIPVLGQEGAAALARQMLANTIDIALKSAVGQVECCITPSPEFLPDLVTRYPPELSWSKQVDGDLGMKMAAIVSRVIDQGQSVILIGTDCPGLTTLHIQNAAQWLQHGDASLIPVEDGGYCLIGLNHYAAELFSTMPWSTDKVAEITRQRIVDLGWRLFETESLFDIDLPADLSRLQPDYLNNN
ncbi:MAG: TIGR04282 family arsenosugar biosynthesis glycosyltransferase [Gammaproteobacteria bacterium]|nr:TIGR04282 family arsenosugar biosynthesis glycosyltransferase [Gammaproteobacteria bacterium]